MLPFSNQSITINLVLLTLFSILLTNNITQQIKNVYIEVSNFPISYILTLFPRFLPLVIAPIVFILKPVKDILFS